MDKVTRLTAEQEAVRNLSTDGRYVVTGPPGTGKSLLAVLRAARIMAQSKPVIVLSKNVPLNSHLKESIAPSLQDIESLKTFDSDSGKSIRTYDSWSSSLWRRVPSAAGKEYRDRRGPMLATDPDWGYDWITAADDVLERHEPENARRMLEIPDNVIVDEGQDLPAPFFEFLMRMCCNVSVFADENQRIYTGMSTIEGIKSALKITKDGGSVFEVRKNFRNTRQVAEVAAVFYVGLPTGIPELPDRLGPKSAAVEFEDLSSLASAIVGLAQRKRGTKVGSGPSVGVVVLQGKRRMRELQSVLEQIADGLDIRLYEKEAFKERPFKFDEAESVTLVTPWTMKGLEWDNVVVVVDGFKLDETPEKLLTQKMQAYVAASRPRSQLLLAWTRTRRKGTNSGPPELLQPLLDGPQSEKVAREWNNAR